MCIRDSPHELRVALARRLARGLAPALLDAAEHALELRPERGLPALALELDLELHVAGAPQELLALALRDLLPRHVRADAELRDDAAPEVGVHALRVLLEARRPRDKRALLESQF